MSSLLFGVVASAVLSMTSLLIVLFRVSPLISPAQAVPAFFLSLLLACSSLATLGFLALWHYVPHHWDTGKLMSVSLRQGIFAGCTITIWTLFLRLGLLNWWVAVIVAAMFVLLELALEY